MRRGFASILLVAFFAACAAAQVFVRGRVTDDNKVAVAGASVSLFAGESSRKTVSPVAQGQSGPTGAFAFELDQPGEYFLHAEHEGFFAIEKLPLALERGENEVTVVLQHVREVYESVDVAYSPPAIEADQTSAEQKITGNDIVFVPYPSSHSLRNAMRTMPGAVVQDAQGDIHVNGGATNQAYWTLDGFNVTDPLTGRFDSSLSVEAVRTVKLSSGRYSAEYGKGSAGALAIDSQMGDDRFRVNATNFVPGVENRKGLTIGEWRPRFNLSGPIQRGKAWFFNSASLQYNKHIVEELPKGQDRTSNIRLSNLLRGQVNLTPSNILYTGILVNTLNAPRTGLGVLTPRETTIDRRSSQYFFHVKDQMYFQQGLVLEVGYAGNRTYGREIPQGSSFLVFTPLGRQGNAFANAWRWARRDQFISSAILPEFSWAGSHQFKVGADWNWLHYRQDVRRTGFERRRLDGTLLRRVTFAGDGSFERSNTEAAWYWQDSWKPRSNWLIQIGVRQDWDRLVSNLTTSPRVSFSWSPWAERDTKISGGYAVVYDATNLQTFSRWLDQYTLTTIFGPQGEPQTGPLITLFTQGRSEPRPPRYQNWSLGIEQRLPGDLYVRSNYLRKRGRDGFTFLDTLPRRGSDMQPLAASLGGAGFQAIHGLRNARRDIFDSLEITLRKTFRNQHVWMGSYTRSRSVSNAAMDINIDTPTLAEDNFGPTPWDAPHRFLSWGYLPLSDKYSLAYMAEWRSGFPFSIEDEHGHILGAVNSHRLPDFLELDLAIERRIRLFGHRWALRFGANNITNHHNPTIADNNIASPNFLQSFGGTPRAFVTRIRWLGRTGQDSSGASSMRQ